MSQPEGVGGQPACVPAPHGKGFAGKNRSRKHYAFPRETPPGARTVVLPRIQGALVLGSLVAREVAVAAGWASEFFFGRPSHLFAYLVENTLNGYLQMAVTRYEQLLGFLLGALVGSAVGLAVWWSPFLSRVSVIAAAAAGQYYFLNWLESRLLRWSREAHLEFIA